MNTHAAHPAVSVIRHPRSPILTRARTGQALLVTFLLSVIPLVPAQAQTTYFWRAEAANGNWNDANNWWNGVTTAVPAGNEIIRFDNTVQLTMANNLASTARFKILFDSGTGARTISGSTLNTFFDFGGTQPLIQNSSANPQTINFPIANGNSTGVNALDIEASGAALNFGGSIYGSGGARRLYFLGSKTNTVSGVISNGVSGGSITIYKEQVGMLILSGNNAFTGGINFNDGELQLVNNNAIGTGTLNIGAAADILSSGSVNIPNPIVLAAGAAPRINGAGVMTLSGIISGSGGLLRGSVPGFNSGVSLNGANTFSGGVTITNNSLQLGHKSALGTGTLTVGDTAYPFSILPQMVAFPTALTNANAVTNPVVLNRDLWLVSGGLDMEFSGPVTLNTNVTLHATPNMILSGSIAGGFGFAVNGNVILRGSNTYSGHNTINSSAILTVSDPANLGTGAVLTNFGTLRIGGTAPFTLGKLQYHSGAYDIVNTNGVTFTNHLVGTGGIPSGFTKLGIGELTLNGNSSNNTSFAINSGTLNFNCPNVNASSRLLVGASSGFTPASNSVANFATTATLGYVSLGNYSASNYTGTLNVSNGVMTLVASASFGLEVGSLGRGVLNAVGGNVVVPSTAPLYIGGMTTYGTAFGQGTFNVSSPSVITVNGTTAENILFGENNAAAAGTLNLDGGVFETSRTFKKTTGSGTINFNGGTLRALGSKTNWIQMTTATVKSGGAVIDSGTFTVTNTQPLLHDTNVTTDGGLTKLGAGRLTLQATNTYNGGTTVGAGTLALNGNGSITNSPVISVASSATLDVAGVTGGFTLGAGQTLKGNGSVAGAVTVNGTVAPGASIGTLILSNAPSLTGAIVAEINRTNAQTADKISFVAASTYGGMLTVTNIGPAVQSGDTFDLFDGPVTGVFAAFNLPVGGLNHWRTNNLVVDGSITFTNNSPVAKDIFLGVRLGESITYQVVGGGKSAASDADGDNLAITSASAAGSGVSGHTASNLTYTASGSLGTNAFTYTVSDGVGGSDTRTVTVLVTTPQGFNKLSGPTLVSVDEYQLDYLGIPGYEYALDESPDLVPPYTWYPVLTNTASGTGSVSFTVPLSYPSGSFRTRYVP